MQRLPSLDRLGGRLRSSITSRCKASQRLCLKCLARLTLLGKVCVKSKSLLALGPAGPCSNLLCKLDQSAVLTHADNVEAVLQADACTALARSSTGCWSFFSSSIVGVCSSIYLPPSLPLSLSLSLSLFLSLSLSLSVSLCLSLSLCLSFSVCLSRTVTSVS